MQAPVFREQECCAAQSVFPDPAMVEKKVKGLEDAMVEVQSNIVAYHTVTKMAVEAIVSLPSEVDKKGEKIQEKVEKYSEKMVPVLEILTQEVKGFREDLQKGLQDVQKDLKEAKSEIKAEIKEDLEEAKKDGDDRVNRLQALVLIALLGVAMLVLGQAQAVQICQWIGAVILKWWV